SVINQDYRLLLYPRATAHDFTADVGSGRTYANINTAIAAIKVGTSSDPGGGSVQSANILLHDSSTFYELSTVTGARYVAAKGFHVIQPAIGITNCTIGRASAPDMNDTGTWAIEPLFDSLEFRN